MQLDSIIKYGKRSNVLNGVEYDFVKLPYWTVKKLIPNALEQGDFMGAVRAVEPNAEENKESLAFSLWLLDSYQAIIEMENKTLVSVPDAKLIDAGIERLNIFGIDNVIDTLAQGLIIYHEQIKQMPYEVVFTKLFKDLVTSEIQENLMRQK